MPAIKQYCVVKVVNMFHPADKYDDWRVNQRAPQIGDMGTLVEILHAPNLPERYVVECVGADGTTIWLSDFSVDEIEAVDPQPGQQLPPERKQV